MRAMRFTSAASGTGETNSRQSLGDDELRGLGVRKQDVENGVAVEVPGAPEHSLQPGRGKGGGKNSPLSRSMLQPVNARAASLMSRSP